MKYQGLSNADALRRQALGLVNSAIDSYSPTYLQIILRNVFNLINIVIIPLLILLLIFKMNNEVIAISVFLIINTLISIIDEARIKREIEQLRSQFKFTAKVIREGKQNEIAANEVVKDDLLIAEEGDSILADGKIIEADYLQLDESNLTGESDYITKESGETVYSGSFIVTGRCYYEVTAIGDQNYSNRLATESTRYRKIKTPLQEKADRLIMVLIFFSIGLGVLNFALTTFNHGLSINSRILSVTAITSLIIPQTLIFLFTLTFTISISRLFKKGVLVQKGAAIENLTNINVICLDKTGTITTNKMLLQSKKFFGFDEELFAKTLNAAGNKLFGVNKTLRVLLDTYRKPIKPVLNELQQVPFNSTNKYSLFSGKIKLDDAEKDFTVVIGAYEALHKLIDPKLRKELEQEILATSSGSHRVLIALQYDKSYKQLPDKHSKQVAIFDFYEELNFGIQATLEKFKELGIKVKIISGDSFVSVKNIAAKVGLITEKIVDLSDKSIDITEVALTQDIFTRATPDDKLQIINALKNSGLKVAMVGDGVNDVLGLKASTVSIAMESGTKVARSVADIVLLNNDYAKVPEIFFEGENIIFNLKLSTKMFLAKSVFAIILALIYSVLLRPLPLLPASTLIFSFLGSSLPSYIVIFTRSKVVRQTNFFTEVLSSAIPVGILMAAIACIFSIVTAGPGNNPLRENTGIALLILGLSLSYSLLLLWQSGKLKSIGLSLFGFTLAFLAGTMQTLLPVRFNESRPLVIFTGVILIIGAILFGWFLYAQVKPQQWWQKIGLGIVAVVWLPLALIFPFRSYYNTERLPLATFGVIFIFIISGTFIFWLIGKQYTKITGAKAHF